LELLNVLVKEYWDLSIVTTKISENIFRDTMDHLVESLLQQAVAEDMFEAVDNHRWETWTYEVSSPNSI